MDVDLSLFSAEVCLMQSLRLTTPWRAGSAKNFPYSQASHWKESDWEQSNEGRKLSRQELSSAYFPGLCKTSNY